jgi:mono/diheme cytochrome c family protein
MRNICRLFIFLSFVVLVTSCGFSKVGEGVAGSCSSTVYGPIGSFAKSVQPILTANCARCHGANATAPSAFAVAAPEAAYPIAKGFVNFAAPASSYFVSRMKTDRHNCGADANCDAIAAAFTTQIQSWWDNGENPSVSLCTDTATTVYTDTPPKLLTYAQTVPSTVTTTATAPLLLTWDLSRVSPDLAGANLRASFYRVIAASALSNGSFNVKDVKLGTSVKKFRISNIRININGHPTNYLNYVSVDFTVAPAVFTPTAATWPFFVVSKKEQSIPFERATGDDVQLGFDIEETALAASPDPGVVATPSQTVFNTQVSPILTRNCQACHSTGQARSAYDLSGSLDQDRLATEAKANNKTNPLASTLLQKGTGAVSHNGGNSLPNATDVTTISNWIRSIP